MKLIYIALAFGLIFSRISGQEMDAKQLNQKMNEIRENTNWDNPAEAKRANEEIKKLSKQLMMVKQRVDPKSDSHTDQVKKENIEAHAKIWDQMMKSFHQGEKADILLGTPVREEIIEEFINDESPEIKSEDYLNEMTLLVIDMSLKTVQRTIDQMERFKSVKTLIITGGSAGAPVDLNDLLKKARNYPLESLYIINFRNFVTQIPDNISRFKTLGQLSLINNDLRAVPAKVSSFKELKAFFIDMNPVSNLLPVVRTMKKLEILGIGKTGIAQSEIDLIQQQLPNCKILLQ